MSMSTADDKGEERTLLATLNISPGTSGDTMTMTATASTTTPERSLANNSAETIFRYIIPEPADLVMLGMDVYSPQVVAGDEVSIYINVDNIGGSPADNVTVRLPLPATVWDCVKPRFEAEQLELVSPIQLVATLGPAPLMAP
jgi:uncharacterized membrane protein